MQNNQMTPRRNLRSSYNGSVGAHFFMILGTSLISIIPFVLPAALCYRIRWNIKHTTVTGVPLVFEGKAGQLFGKLIKWGILSILTLTLYGMIVAPVRYKEWVAANTVFGPIN